MPSFYDVLGLPRDASHDDIRRAYKKKALATHPDRLGPNPSVELKAEAEEKFRLVNNAYEVLNDTENRKLYDKYGVWPPPRPGEMDEPPAHRSRHHSRRQERPSGHYNAPFTDPFENFQRHFHTDIPNMHHGHFHFTRDLNDMFRSMDDMFEGFNDQFANFGYAPPRHYRPFQGNLPFGISIGTGGGHSGGFRASHSTSFSSSTRIGSESETYKETIVNGVRRSVLKKIDRNGNVHVTETDGDGRKTYIVNGIVQPPGLPEQRPIYVSLDNHIPVNHINNSGATQHRKSPSRRHSPGFGLPPPVPPPQSYEPPLDWNDKGRSHHHRHHNRVYENSDDDDEYDEDLDRAHRRRHSPTHHEYGHRFAPSPPSPKRNKWWPF